MSTVGELLVRLGVTDLAGLKSGLGEGEAAIGRFGAAGGPAAALLNKEFGSIQSAALDTAKTLGVAFGAFKIGEFLGDSIKAAIEEEAGIKRLGQSLIANVPAFDGNTEAIERIIAAREDLGFADDELRTSLSGLVGATHDVNAALAIQNTAMDLARFKGISLAEASDALTKIEAGRFRALAGLGIVLREGATQTEALAAVQAVAAGQAKAFGETAAGAGQAAAVAFHDAEEEIGTALLPLMKELALTVKDDVAPALRDAAALIGTVTKAGDDLAKILNDIVKLGPKVHDAIAGPPDAGAAVSERAALDAMQAYAAELRRIDDAVADGTLTQEEATKATDAASDAYRTGVVAAKAAGDAYVNGAADAERWAARQLEAKGAADVAGAAARDHAAGLDEAGRAALALTVALGTSTGASKEQQQAAADAKAEFDKLGTVFDGFNSVVVTSARGMDQFGFHSRDAMDDASAAFYKAGGAADDLKDSIDALPREVEINVVTKFTQSGAGAFGVGAFAEPPAGNTDFGGIDGASANLGGTTGDPEFVARQAALAAAEAKRAAEQAAREAKSAHDKAVREAEAAARKATAAAEKAAAAQAAAYREKLGAAFDAVRHAAEAYFDKLHELNLTAIRDAHDHANALLDAQKAANLKPVTEAQELQDAIVHQRELAKLQASLAEAQGEKGVDPAQKAADVLAATQALADFQAQARIAALQANADTANADIDAQKAKNDTLAADATQAENDRATAQREAFANDLKTLEASLSKHPETWAKTQQEILKLLMGYGVDYKKAAQNLGDQFAAGLLSSTRAAEEAAAALANAAGAKLGATPKPTAGRPVGTLGEGIVLEIHIHNEIDGEQVSETVERRMAASYSRQSSGR